MPKSISNSEISDAQLLAYLEGEADPEITNAIERSDTLKTRARQLDQESKRLVTTLYRFECPDTVTLGEYHLNTLLPKVTKAVARHVAICPRCTQELNQHRAFLGEPEKKDRLKELKVMIAQLVSPMLGPGQQVPVLIQAGARGTEEGPLMYEVDDVQISIAIQDDSKQPGRKNLLGLVLGMEAAGLVAHLMKTDRHISTVPIDESGTFVAPGLIPSEYDLIIEGPEVEVHLRKVKI